MLKKLFSILFLCLFSICCYAEEPVLKYNYYDDDEDLCITFDDPYESLNRKIFLFNGFLDTVFLHPASVIYRNIIPGYGRARIGDFIDNMKTPYTMVNNVAQMRFHNALENLWRFLINSTFGLLGTFDVARKFNINYHSQNFGNTLAFYGVAPGPYLVLPLLGPSNLRDITDILVSQGASPSAYILDGTREYIYLATDVLQSRTEYDGLYSLLSKSADPYSALRSVYYSKRNADVSYPKDMRPLCNHKFYRRKL